MSFLFSHLSILVPTLSSSQFQPTVEEHEELIWLARNLKLEVTKYSKQIYGPRGFAHLGDDDDNMDQLLYQKWKEISSIEERQ